MSSVSSETLAEHTRIPVHGLAGGGALAFSLFLDQGNGLEPYVDAGDLLGEERALRLVEDDSAQLLIRSCDRVAWLKRVSLEPESVLLESGLDEGWRCAVLAEIAAEVHSRVFVAEPSQQALVAAQRLMMTLVRWLRQEPEVYPLLRGSLVPGKDEVGHALAVALLSIRLAGTATSSTNAEIEALGFAAFIHDIGSAAGGPVDTSPEHSRMGHAHLLELGVSPAIAELVLHHHERHDGSGFPDGLRAEAIPVLAQVLGIVDAFDRMYSLQELRIGIYDGLRILAQAYAGCFAPQLETAFFGLFRDDGLPPARSS